MPFSSFARPAELARALRHSDAAILLAPAQMFGRDMAAFIAEALPSLDRDPSGPIRSPEASYPRSIVLLGAKPDPHWMLAARNSAREDKRVAVGVNIGGRRT